MSDSPLFFLYLSDPSYFLFPVTSAVNNICFGPRLEGPRAAAGARPSGGSATDTCPAGPGDSIRSSLLTVQCQWIDHPNQTIS